MEFAEVHKVVRDVRLRLARNLFLRALCVCLFWGSAAFAAALLLHRIFSPPFGEIWLLAAAALSAPAVASWLVLRRFPSPLAAAVETDRAFALKEEISSSLYVASLEGPVADAFRQRAEAAAARVRPRGRFPFRLPLEGKALPLPVLGSALLFLLVPDLDILGLLRQREDGKRVREDVRVTAEDLSKRLRSLEKKSELLSFDGAKQVVQDMQQVAALLERNTADEKQALSHLSSLEEKLRQRAADPKIEAVRKLFQPKGGAGSRTDSELVKKIQRALKEGGREKAAKELFDQLKSMQDAFAGKEMNPEDMAKMARELQSLVRALELPPELLEKIQRLAEALEKKAQGGDANEYKSPPPELDFTMEELLELLKNLDEEEFLKQALDEVGGTRQGLIERLKICPYCKKNLKHPWEGGTPLPGMGPDGAGGEPGVGYI